jgi:hypothetical protein
MKRIGIVLLLITLVSFGSFGQTFNFDTVQSNTKTMVESLGGSLALANTLGLTWSSDFIGGFPHFGVGFSAGGAWVPTEAFSSVLSTFGVNLSDLVPNAPEGLPFPVVNLEARLGVPFLPLDVGVKFGTIPKDLNTEALVGINAEYLSGGIDVRYRLLKENLVLPGVSLGIGGYLFSGGFSKDGLLGGDQTITSISDGTNTYDIRLKDPSFGFGWNAQTLDVKVQVSKNLLFFRPYLGLGYAFSRTSAGAGLESTVQISDDGGSTYNPITEAQIQAIKDYYAAQDQTPPDLSAEGFLIQTAQNGWNPRVFGGMSMNILLLKLDINASFDPLTQQWGGTIGGRIQF